MLYSIVGLLVIILDQAVKFWVSDTLFGTDVVRFIPGVLSLVNVHNDGAAFSFLSGQGARIYFIVATGIFVILVIIALATNFIRGKFSRWCLVLVAAGGLGNMIDRVIYGYVQDMFKVELFNFAIFNVADVFITLGAIFFALSMFFEKPESDLNDVLYEQDDEEEEPKKKKLSRKERKAAKEAAKAEAEKGPEEPKPKKQKQRHAGLP
jgi:signal peptidase II